jgi:hypothetical protein
VSDTQTQTATKTPTMSQLDFCRRFNAVCRGEATYDETSQSVKFDPEVTFEAGAKVPATRKGIAVYCGLSYNAMLSREKQYKEQGANLFDLAKGKRGRTTDIAAINAALAEDVTAADMTKDA